ncbi:MAG: putative toxin-antitoxin system toxin component, PIN family, partial [Dehalococcoidia bacterium]|nr:putative toxin-antitoxin system toxin component, PIN family [Dehalococcoidia bacterium]
MTKRDEPVSAVVDTKLFISGLIKRPSIPHQVVEAVRQGAFTLVLSAQLLTEYRQVLPRPKFREKYGLTVEEVGAFLFLVETNAHMVEPLRRLPVKV